MVKVYKNEYLDIGMTRTWWFNQDFGTEHIDVGKELRTGIWVWMYETSWLNIESEKTNR